MTHNRHSDFERPVFRADIRSASTIEYRTTRVTQVVARRFSRFAGLMSAWLILSPSLLGVVGD
jgi:hypothetical protein